MKIEHINIAVPDLDEAVKFITTACPEFRIRGGYRYGEGRHWIHVGSPEIYVAFEQATEQEWAHVGHSGQPGVNHIGCVVDSLDEVSARLLAAGYREAFQGETTPTRRSSYFADACGFQWEFVEYLTDDLVLRAQYDE